MNKVLIAFFTVLLTVAAFGDDKPAASPSPSPVPEAPATPAPPSPEDVNYALGLLIGQSLGNTGLDVNLDEVFQGIRDIRAKDKPPRFDAEKAKQIVSQALTASREKQQQAKIDQEKIYLTDHAKKQGVVTTASGLQYEVLKQGTGPLPKVTDTVKVDYVGTLTDGTEFDSSIKRGEPAVFPLNQVIPAWTEGLQLMPVGSKFRFTIPSSLAYGAQGAGEVIPPFATLIFEVDLIAIEKPTATVEPGPSPSPAPAQ